MNLAHYLGLLHRAQVNLAGDLLDVVRAGERETAIQLTWLRGRMKQAAPQALVVAT